MTQPSESDLVAAARSWLGEPWRHQGRGTRGIDCVGLLIRIAHDFNLTEFDITTYNRRAKGVGFEQHFVNHMNKISLLDLCESDVIVFRDEQYPCHCAMYSESTGRPTIIHSHALRRKVIEEGFEGEWKEKALMAFRFRHLKKGSK